jgi:hypothetical protein
MFFDVSTLCLTKYIGLQAKLALFDAFATSWLLYPYLIGWLPLPLYGSQIELASSLVFIYYPNTRTKMTASMPTMPTPIHIADWPDQKLVEKVR